VEQVAAPATRQYDLAVLHRIAVAVAAHQLPAIERLAVKQRHKALFRGGKGRRGGSDKHAGQEHRSKFQHGH
jgi:hypothetical protein